MLLKQGEEKPASDGQKPAEQKPAPEPGPQSRLFERLPSFALVGEAFAAENNADQLAIEISSMPDVLKAYDEMKARLPQLDALRDRGGGGNQPGARDGPRQGAGDPPGRGTGQGGER